MLFINDEVPFDPVYNGVTFPEYWYEGMDKTGIELTYQDRKEYLYRQLGDQMECLELLDNANSASTGIGVEIGALLIN